MTSRRLPAIGGFITQDIAQSRISITSEVLNRVSPGQTVIESGVKIVSPLNVPSTMAEHASQLYAKNIQALLELMTNDEGALALDFEDEIIAGACITKGGEIVNEGAKAAAGQGGS